MTIRTERRSKTRQMRDADTISRQYAREEGYAAGVVNPSAVNPYKGHDAGLAVPLAQSWQLGFDVARIHLNKQEA